MNKEKIKGWLGQPSIIKSLEQKFGERAMKERLSKTPGTLRFIVRRLENKENRGVWRKIDKVKIPENRRLIGNKWVFKIKRD